MTQPHLFADFLPPETCRDCVVWNGLWSAPAGDCSINGRRAADAPKCESFFTVEIARPWIVDRVREHSSKKDRNPS